MVASLVGGTTIAAAQQKIIETYQMHVNDDEEVWPITTPTSVARQAVLRLGHELKDDGLDCSHLVHDIYERAGFPYDYATSRDLYDGVDGFRRVYHPMTGDIVVWRGHVGILLDPDDHSFLSALRTGVKVSQYDTKYWQRRGHPRFYRYSIPGGTTPDWSQSSARSSVASDDAE